MRHFITSLLLVFSVALSAQDSIAVLQNQIKKLEADIVTLKYTELVQSMCQRSMLTPAYFADLKALIARQAYDFWKAYQGNPLVSHLNVYAALYDANKYLGYDSINKTAYNQALGHNASVTSVHFGSNPNHFYSAGSDGKVLRWVLNDGSHTPELIYEGKHLIRSIDVGLEDRWILIVTKEQGIVMVESEVGSENSSSNIIIDPEPVQAAAFIPGENKLITINRQGDIKVKGFGGVEVKGKTNSQVTSMAVNAQTRDFYLGSKGGNVEIWEDTLAAKIYLPESFAVNTMAISPDFSMLALGREKGDVIVWDLLQENFIRKISGHQSAITDVDFSPDSRMLLTASRDRTVRVWEIFIPQKLPLVLDDHDDWVMTACFSPDGQQIISGSKDNYIRFWPLEPEVLANRICELVDRKMTTDEWKNYVGSSVPYRITCDQ